MRFGQLLPWDSTSEYDLDVDAHWELRQRLIEREEQLSRLPEYVTDLEVRVRSQNVRAIARGLIGDLTPAEWSRWCKAWGGRCAYCGRKGRMVVEHVIPISLGGSTTLSNVVPACHDCNAAKRGMGPDVWLPVGDFEAFLARVLAANDTMASQARCVVPVSRAPLEGS